ncbi:protein of unknown function [Marinobacterium sediminicola]|uniref:YfiR family protein n=2 Tax=Marinobacterium sediminicola TaxID=518898 RepID=A0ABY1S0G6_9GAMM|nr:protein of unknown function [Marinobacterium sediminicola]
MIQALIERRDMKPYPVQVALWLSLCACCLIASSRAFADPQSEKVSLIKAAFVYNMAKFVDWPQNLSIQRQDRFVICYYREDFLGRGFESIQGKKVQQRPVEKRVIDALHRSNSCDVVLIGTSQLQQFHLELDDTLTDPVLTIADLTEPGTRNEDHHHAMINLVRDGKGMGFEVNLNLVTQAGLTISSELLKLARVNRP